MLKWFSRWWGLTRRTTVQNSSGKRSRRRWMVRRSCALEVEFLEQRLLLTTARFAVIGDYGLAGTSEGQVSALVHGWNPDFILTVGDNNYQTGQASTIDANVGQYYHDFISPYSDSYGAGSATNRFFSVTDTAGAGNDNVTLTLSVGHGTLSVGITTGLTVSGNGTSGSPLTLSGSLSALNADSPSLLYIPTANYSGLDSLSLTILDTSDQVQGLPAQVAITVNPSG